MAKAKTQYKCEKCEWTTPKWQGQCRCGEWNTLKEVAVEDTSKKAVPSKPRSTMGGSEKPQRLRDVKVVQNQRIQLKKDQEFNRVMGGGIIRDSVTILTAPPGAGKSTLLLMVAEELAELGHRVYYASGEESTTQIKQRADRIVPDLHENVWIQSETNLNVIAQHINEIDPDVIIIDSINTLYVEELPSSAGSPTQVEECTSRIIQICKNPSRKRAGLLISQMNKEDELAGRRSLEHAVDAVLHLEGERREQLRILAVNKNRYGSTDESGLYLMSEQGLIPIDDPSEFFITKRDKPVAGSALTVTREGTRNLVVEVESLTERTVFGYPTRVSEGINKQQLQILCGTLEKRAGLRVSDKDVYVKVASGLKLQETSVNLGVLMSIVSSVYNKGIATDTVFIGEVGLTGEVKTVPYLESRLKELDRLGFKQAYVPKGNLRSPLSTKKLKVIEVGTLDETIKKIYPIPFQEA